MEHKPLDRRLLGTSRYRPLALLRRLCRKPAELRHNSRALTRWAPDLSLLVVRNGHGQLERLLALLAEELVAWHGQPPSY